ncbi:MAG TPA: hypothetical protein VLQ80_01390, partial [Candidatus Saccharimonadia bacterium]|nr:hypothetical protein [Candidatus Saccharimonadia bacterium]
DLEQAREGSQGTHTGEEAAMGRYERAMALLRQQAHSSDDPEYAAQLARLLKEVGQLDEAHHWREIAAARYDELMVRHPEAFADHAAEFWLQRISRSARRHGHTNSCCKPQWLPRRQRLSVVLPSTCGRSIRWGRVSVRLPCAP